MKLKTFLFMGCIILFAFPSSAQKAKNKSGHFEIGLTPGIPTGLLGRFSNFTYGFDLQAVGGISKQAQMAFSFGYQGFVAKYPYTINGGLVPILLVLQLYPAEKVFIVVQAGVSLATQSGTAFTYSAGLGIKPSQKINILMKYQSASFGSNNSFIGLRTGISL